MSDPPRGSLLPTLAFSGSRSHTSPPWCEWLPVELGHPCKQNIAAWKERVGVTGTDTGAWDSHIYGLCAKLKPTSTSKRPLASGGSSGGGGGPPSESTEPAAKAKKTPFTADENALYLTLLRRHGRPLKKNAEAWAAFRNAFPKRVSDSWAGHMQHFTTDEAGAFCIPRRCPVPNLSDLETACRSLGEGDGVPVGRCESASQEEYEAAAAIQFKSPGFAKDESGSLTEEGGLAISDALLSSVVCPGGTAAAAQPTAAASARSAAGADSVEPLPALPTTTFPLPPPPPPPAAGGAATLPAAARNVDDEDGNDDDDDGNDDGPEGVKAAAAAADAIAKGILPEEAIALLREALGNITCGEAATSTMLSPPPGCRLTCGEAAASTTPFPPPPPLYFGLSAIDLWETVQLYHGKGRKGDTDGAGDKGESDGGGGDGDTDGGGESETDGGDGDGKRACCGEGETEEGSGDGDTDGGGDGDTDGGGDGDTDGGGDGNTDGGGDGDTDGGGDGDTDGGGEVDTTDGGGESDSNGGGGDGDKDRGGESETDGGDGDGDMD
ncbi:hypothetical protein EMIHUDRAFT_113959 [Emiliania huxleyi CCMP1516]|uniref:Myb-like domain-containing protein n=2 Tax=Emiliania huxleyi TaxID=2903 RepID=A0A0D3JZQ7_EMIH1|nr:hypothetical protein EMIHUDRAFT_113959 [Emiliania huxleyi CCMP1516]EOD28992.1 hypothetical protein EMIHUDRAFT_113959 [Emiliania huxleyi CCMP1516]|eukprot:XP_005781421.1 hypothetical protein EMIHUDRAFT_113959 [Emiliania huxleyi CCMP1516]